MGKFYTVRRNNLYIFVAADDELISLRDLPSLLGLFEAEAAWRWNNKMAICHNVSEDSLRQAEVILGIYGYKRKDLDEHLLERYFAEGDKRLLLSEKKATLMLASEKERVSRMRKKPIEELWRAEASFIVMLPKLETAHKKGWLKEEVHMQERGIIEEKLEAYRREEKERFAEILSEVAGKALTQEMLEKGVAKRWEIKRLSPNPLLLPNPSAPTLPQTTPTDPRRKEVPLKEKAIRLLLEKLQNYFEETR